MTFDAVDHVSAEIGFDASPALSAMRKDLYAWMEERGWHMTGSGVGESHYTNAKMIDVSARMGGRAIIVEIHDLGVLS